MSSIRTELAVSFTVSVGFCFFVYHVVCSDHSQPRTRQPFRNRLSLSLFSAKVINYEGPTSSLEGLSHSPIYPGVLIRELLKLRVPTIEIYIRGKLHHILTVNNT
jgi:hypothetical protein